MKNQLFCKKKVMFGVVLILTTTMVMYLSHVTDNYPVNRKRQKKDHNSRCLEDVSSKCNLMDEDKNLRQSKTTIFEALKQDGFKPITLSKLSCLCDSDGKSGYTSNSDTSTVTKNTLPGSRTNRTTPMRTTPISQLVTALALLTTSYGAKPVSTVASGNRNDQNSSHFYCRIECKKRRELIKQDGVPNVVHYVFIGSDFRFTFIMYLSFLSVQRFIQPDQIFIHGNAIPSGHWWNETIKRVTNIYHVQRSYEIKAPNGQPFKFIAHISDYIRAEILVRYGGIYIDPDVLVLNSFDPLRKFEFVLGRESGDSVGNGIILTKRGSTFLRFMLEQYWSYKGLDEEWAKQSVHQVHTLSLLYPHLIHVEETSLNRPNWMERSTIYEGNYNWTNNYAMHLWLRMWPTEKVPTGLEDVLNKTTTIGEISRLILFGSERIL